MVIGTRTMEREREKVREEESGREVMVFVNKKTEKRERKAKD
jgi:hypothetical protein